VHVALFEAPTPSCGSTLHATVGTPLTFTVKASDADSGDVVDLAVIDLPAGAHLSTPLPANGNPVSTDFSWTPAAGDTGSHVITFTAFDGCAAGPTQCSFTVNVGSAGGGQPLNCSGAFVANSEIWPPNGRMVPVNVQGIVDPNGEPVAVHVTSITQDEGGSGDVSCDANIDGNGHASVRARRDGNGNGRVYHVTFTASDATGASCQGSVQLCVPHDQGRHNQCVDDGAIFTVTCSGADSSGDGGGGDAGGGDAGTKKDAIDLKVTEVSGGVAQVQYTLPVEAQTTLFVYNVAGRRVATLVDGRQPAGTSSIQWVARNLARSVYFVQLRSGNKQVVQRIIFFYR
jgi:hypothetical protein